MTRPKSTGYGKGKCRASCPCAALSPRARPRRLLGSAVPPATASLPHRVHREPPIGFGTRHTSLSSSERGGSLGPAPEPGPCNASWAKFAGAARRSWKARSEHFSDRFKMPEESRVKRAPRNPASRVLDVASLHRRSSFRHLVTWESTVVVLCALVLSIVFGFFIHQSFHSRTSNGLMAAYDTHDSHDNVDASNWPHRDAEAVSMKGSVDIRRLEGPTFRTRKSKTRKHISSKRHTTKSTMKDTKTHGPRAQQRVPEKQKSLNEKLKKTKKKKKNNSAKALKPKTIPSTTEESNEPVKGLKPSGISNHLLCFMSDNATDKMQMPAEYCTHLVYKDMTLSKQSHTFVPAKNGTGFDEFMSLRERFVTTKFVVSLSTAMVRELLDYADRDDHNLAAICTQLAKWISENELNGVAFTGQLITSTRHKSMLAVLKSVQDALKQLGEPKPALIYSGYASHDQYTQKSIMDRIKDYLRAADIFVIETHYHEEEQFCRLVYPSIFVRVDDTPSSIPVKSALLWMEMVKEDGGLNGTHNLCFSLDMSTMSFDVAANSRPTVGGWCTGRKWINYGQMCGTNVWVTPDEDRVALSTSRRKPQTWLAYDSEDAIKKKARHLPDTLTPTWH
ncbi:hypothetical protein HPB49_015115 [Dermacentor silvarum]|uniref:Uncharacterized protein n=1 Tax=Dermacentor silvarum TaxID=543639 RepID=A0ACB8CA31_DERSI|nr:hypothetical protein HPB49_015115 [Dermacentor silvarum]